MHPPSMQPRAQDFPHSILETLRFADTDRNGHITSSVFAICCQSGRLDLLSDPTRKLTPPSSQFVLARLVLDYRREMHWPGTVEIGTRVERIGRSSITLAQALFQNGCCVATAQSVAVLMERDVPPRVPHSARVGAKAATVHLHGHKRGWATCSCAQPPQRPGEPASERAN